MNEREMLEWGRLENATRKREIAGVKSQGDLERVQKDARRRRLSVSLSAGQAVHAVKLAQMEEAARG